MRYATWGVGIVCPHHCDGPNKLTVGADIKKSLVLARDFLCGKTSQSLVDGTAKAVRINTIGIVKLGQHFVFLLGRF